MTTYTPILNLPEVSPNQQQKEATINTAIAILEAAMNDTLVVSLATADLTFSVDQFTKYFHHQFFGHTVARTVTVPETPRWFSVENRGTASITIKSADPSSGALVCILPAGKIGLIVSDGHDLKFVVPDPTGGIGRLEDLSNVAGTATGNQLLRYNGTDSKWEPWTLSLAFSDLTDFPGSYSSNASHLLAVKSDGSGLEWITSAANITHFTDLTDTPSNYSGSANLTVKVNSGANGLIFSQPKLTEAFDYPSSYTGANGKFLQVVGTAVQFQDINLEDIVNGPGAPATGDALKYVQVSSDGSRLVYSLGTGGPDAFAELVDTPHSYTTFAKQYPRVNAAETGLEFHQIVFTDLADTPNALTGQQSKLVAVNAGATALEFRSARVGDLSDGPGAYAGKAKQVVRVNAGATAWEYAIVAITDLSGFPSTFTGQGGKFLQVKSDETGIQFSTSSFSTSFLALTDTPDVYTGQANKYLAVNAGATGVEFRTFPVIPVNLTDLADVDTTTGTPASGSVLMFHDGIWSAETLPASSGTLAGLTDVDFTTHAPTDQQALVYDAATSKWIPSTVTAGATSLDQLTDVDFATTAPTTGDVLTYDGTSWVPAAPTGGGGTDTGGTLVNHDYGSAMTGDTITLGHTPTVNNWLVVVSSSDAFNAANPGAGWSRYSHYDDGTSYLSVGVYYHKVQAGDTATITPTSGTALAGAYAVFEFTNIQGGFPAAFKQQSQTFGHTVTPPTFTAEGAMELLCVAFQRNATVDITMGGGTYDVTGTTGHGNSRDVTIGAVHLQDNSFAPTVTFDTSADQSIYTALLIDLNAGPSAFTALTDTPGVYTGFAKQVVSVKSDETGLEFTVREADIGFFFAGTTDASELLARYAVVTPFVVQTTGHEGSADTGATASAVFTFSKNGSSFGTATFASSSATATISISTTTSFTTGDILTVTAPSTPDLTLANISFTLKAIRN